MVAGGRMRTKPLIPEMCFTTTTEEDAECEEQPVTPHLEEDGTSLLISCSQCSVRVHASEYTRSWTKNIGCKYSAQPVCTQSNCSHRDLLSQFSFPQFSSVSSPLKRVSVEKEQHLMTQHWVLHWLKTVQCMLTDLHTEHTQVCRTVFVFVCFRLLRCGSSHCEQRLEMCALQSSCHDWGQWTVLTAVIEVVLFSVRLDFWSITFSFLQNCCLCSLRGGALQKANNNKWVDPESHLMNNKWHLAILNHLHFENRTYSQPKLVIKLRQKQTKTQLHSVSGSTVIYPKMQILFLFIKILQMFHN